MLILVLYFINYPCVKLGAFNYKVHVKPHAHDTRNHWQFATLNTDKRGKITTAIAYKPIATVHPVLV
jgi:hypothetical protein